MEVMAPGMGWRANSHFSTQRNRHGILLICALALMVCYSGMMLVTFVDVVLPLLFALEY